MPANASSTAVPISVPASQQWDGNDGPWSSFNVHVGTPAQVARVLVSSTVGETWVISQNSTQGGCLSTDPTTCPNSRGGLFNVNASSTWQDQGIYALGDEQNLPDYLDQYDNGDYGFDNLGVGQPGNGGVALDGMVVAALATKDYYLGNIGVNQQPTNFSTFSDPKPSFLKSLKQSGKIPSLTWAYTAGNQYRAKKVFGSLTLGGSDTARYTPNGNSFEFAGDISRDLVVGLQSITFSDNTTTDKSLLDSGILAFVDATVPHIWLPIPACQAFEKAFGIEYNSTANRYLVNDTQHAAMQSQNASVSFVLGNVINGGSTVNITLPYAAFDLTTGYPVVESDKRYFPLRQAANDTQYTLGRTFLQEAYVIVDYERSNFSISQATFLNAPSNLVPIEATSASTPSGVPGATKVTTKTTSTLSTGAIIGIALAAIVLLALAGFGTFFFIRRRRRAKSGSQKLDDEPKDPLDKPEMDGQGTQLPIELFGPDKNGLKDFANQDKSEIEMEGSKAALDAKLAAEMQGDEAHHHEMAAATGGSILTGRKVAEMEGEGDVPIPIEMYAGPHGLFELDSPRVTSSDGPPTAGRSSAGLPTPTSASGMRSSDGGAPSPISPASDSRHGSVGGGRRASWTRRSKPVPRLPSETEDTSGISSQDERGSSSSAGGIWAPRRSSRPLGAGTAFKTPHSPPSQNQAQITPPEPSYSRDRTGSGAGPSAVAAAAVGAESTRDRHRRGADALTARLESSASLASSSSAYVTPREGSSPRPSDRFESWNQRFGSSSQPQSQLQHQKQQQQQQQSQQQQRTSDASSIYPPTPATTTTRGVSSTSGGRRPSDHRTGSETLLSPVSPSEAFDEEDEDNDDDEQRLSSPRIPSPRVPSPRVPSPRVPSPRVPSPRVPNSSGPSSRGPSSRGPSPQVPSPRVVHTPRVVTPGFTTPQTVSGSGSGSGSRGHPSPQTRGGSGVGSRDVSGAGTAVGGSPSLGVSGSGSGSGGSSPRERGGGRNRPPDPPTGGVGGGGFF